MSWTCALSGEPLNETEDEVVVTPSGRLCSKRLLLSKLAENGGTDPFQEGRPLSSDDLVTISTKGNIMPPRPHGGTSLPSLLKMMQQEYDALVLELFDTRKALEETRKELSQALYQNDAAVRVVARLATERDAARQELQQWNASSAAVVEAEQPEAAAAEEERAEPDTKRRKVEEKEPQKATLIPQEHMDVMVETWKNLSKQRKDKKKLQNVPDVASYEEVDSKSWHKTRSKAGILAVACWNHIVGTAGRDKQIITYDSNTKTLVNTISSLPALVVGLDLNENYIVSGGADGWVRLYSQEDGSYLDGVELGMDKKDAVVHVVLHPTGKHVLATTKTGRVTLLAITDENKLQVTTNFVNSSNDDDLFYTCGALHPDGLIYGAGTNKGTVHMWDLKSQSLASTLASIENEDPISAMAFSNNGYHIATCSEDNSKVLVWDLRKLKVSRILNHEGKEVLESPSVVAFDRSGKHLAYGAKDGAHVTTVKEWGITAKLSQDHNVTGIVWGDNFIATCSDNERQLRFHGLAEVNEDNAMEE